MDPGLWRTVKVVFGRLFITPRGIRLGVRSDQGSERQAPATAAVTGTRSGPRSEFGPRLFGFVRGT
jgi:hypothetical protein